MDQESFMIITVQGSSGPLPSRSQPSETRNRKLEESLFVTKRFIKQENNMTMVGQGPPISCYGCQGFFGSVRSSRSHNLCPSVRPSPSVTCFLEHSILHLSVLRQTQVSVSSHLVGQTEPKKLRLVFEKIF